MSFWSISSVLSTVDDGKHITSLERLSNVLLRMGAATIRNFSHLKKSKSIQVYAALHWQNPFNRHCCHGWLGCFTVWLLCFKMFGFKLTLIKYVEMRSLLVVCVNIIVGYNENWNFSCISSNRCDLLSSSSFWWMIWSVLPHLTTSMEAAPDLKKSVESSMAATLLRIPFQMFCDKKTTTIFTFSIQQWLKCYREFIVQWKKQQVNLSICWWFTCPDLLCHLLLIIRQLHAGALPSGEVFGSRDHLPVFKLQVLHQQLWGKHAVFKQTQQP